ncbi:ABC transporter ATP-binding protein [Roseiflexus sp.]|jgi:ABC-2 type transport system ATP-binding protein|uniref:ABC transporter ATP-binding protein n=1 Tax=Roseiflexus TaxID=120961 RepID=UPI000CBA6466|nr:ABC transporter ATP-binding protein [Roseiflexus sp.]PMP80194.1 MAG: ABC transporter ATP-binding protein [Roseiflexus castenholzii]GIW02846.1 MAG: ABC transporter ATP-binding protein [Roseiflexus sp.]
MDAVIRTEELTKRFGDRVAVDRINLEIRPGEIFGFLGPNGAGKTTTIGMLLGLIRPTSGRAFVLGYDIQREAAAALREVGAMIEAPAFYPYLSGRDNLRVLARAAGLPDRRVDEALAQVDLTARGRDRFSAYSQGMKQRLGIAAALLHEPRLIMLDEPTNGLDPAGQLEIRNLVRSLSGSGRTVFLCSHLLHEVEQVCQRVAILKQGRIIAQGDVASLLRRGVLVRTIGERERAEALLRSTPWVSRISTYGDAFLIDAPGDRTADLNALLTAGGVPVAEIRHYETSLEEFFLEVTAERER